MSQVLNFYNTRTRQIEEFKPLKSGHVGIYSCGPTVYSYAHIGNMRAYIFADILRRSLEHFGYKVNHVMNITDVGHLTDDGDDGEDKLEVGSRREGVDAWAVAKKYTEAFFAHAKLLNIQPVTTVCKATDYIPEQIQMVKELEAKGYTYNTTDGVYFDTEKFPRYADFAKLDVEGLEHGHRVEAGEKRAKTDFALWKFSKPEEKRCMEWDSPWGRGFPGWHIECSAMSVKLLGKQFDIHTGGVDHIPIHHTNEIAQSECATGLSPFVRYWMHGEFLIIEDAAKMSKSLGNILTVGTLQEKGFNPLAYRFFVLQTHYRKQLKFSLEALSAAQRGFERLLMSISRLEGDEGVDVGGDSRALDYLAQFNGALASDLNMPQAMAIIHAVVDDGGLSGAAKKALLQKMDFVLGLGLFAGVETTQTGIPAELESLLAQRNAARKAKDWKESDRLRDEITSRGYEILDSPSGSSLKRILPS